MWFALLLGPAASLPVSFNWCSDMNHSCTPVMNQYAPNHCGSCWAISAVTAVSDRLRPHLINAGLPEVVLSAQDVLDCGRLIGLGHGCKGGKTQQVFEFIRRYGIVDATCNPYQARDLACDMSGRCRTCDPNCRVVESYSSYYISEYDFVKGDEAMMKEIYTRGPIVCGVALPKVFWDYTSGVLKEPRSHPLDHDVEVVGWGRQETPDGPLDYWRIKNSFGMFWGENGYGRLLRTNSSLSYDKCYFPVFDPSNFIKTISPASPFSAESFESSSISSNSLPVSSSPLSSFSVFSIYSVFPIFLWLCCVAGFIFLVFIAASQRDEMKPLLSRFRA